MKNGAFYLGVAIFIMLMSITLIAAANPTGARIDGILDEETIVLNDVTFKISANAYFLAQDERTPIPFSNLKEGDHVGFSVNSDGEIDEIWLISE